MVIVGCIGAPHGVKGWLKIRSFTEPFDNITRYRPWHIETATGWQEASVEAIRTHHQRVVAKWAGCEDREQAKAFTQMKIGVPRTQLPTLPKEEYYWEDLKGLSAATPDGTPLGIIKHVMATGANDVLFLGGIDSREHAIPFLQGDVIKTIDLKTRSMVIDWDLDF